MTFKAGSTLGPYELDALIGAGGMGEVFRARDTRLDRVVAIKVLHESFAADPERLRRFEQEAKTLAAMNHQNILAVLDIGKQDGSPYLVSEFLDGETLREKLDRGPIAVRKAIEYALGIAHGLAAGHSKGIVHRDLKPENVFITREGGVKILDYGLAKLEKPPLPNNSETLLTSQSTMVGVVLGTMGYMSPEQVRGEPAEATSDIFSFGSVLYEMLTGKRAFKGTSAADTMSAVLREEPPELMESGFHGPAGLQRIVERCLEKDPRQRFQSASDLAFAIEAVSGSGSASGSGVHSAIGGVAPMAAARKNMWLWPVLAVCVLALCAGVWWMAEKNAAKDIPRFRQLTFQRGFISMARFSKDGETVVYSGQFNNDPMKLYSVRMNQLQPVTIAAPNAALFGVSQQDNLAVGVEPKQLSHYIIGTLAEMPLTGGAPREMLANVVAASYAPDGTMAVARILNGKCQLEYPMGTKRYENSGYMDYLRVSPDGKMVAFVDHQVLGDDRGYLSVMDADGKVRRLTDEYESLQGLAWTRDGKQIWYTGSLDGNMFEARAMDLQGHDRALLGSLGWPRIFDIAADGRVLMGNEEAIQTITAGDGAGKEFTHLELYNGSELEDISPDGKAVLFEEWGGPSGRLYLVVYRRVGAPAPVILGPGATAALSPDGKTVASYLMTTPPKLVLYPVGPGERSTVDMAKFVAVRRVIWMPDGKRVGVVGAQEGQAMRSYTVNATNDEIKTLGPEGFQAEAFSHDGKRAAGTLRGEQVILDLTTNEVKPIAGLNPGETVQRWSKDDGSLFVGTSDGATEMVQKMDLATGKRTMLQKVTLKEQAGLIPDLAGGLLVAEDEKSYGYEARMEFSTLYEVSGVK